MAKFVPPPLSLRIVWLGQQLKALREANKLTLKAAGDYLQRDPSTVGRFESGEYPIRRPDLASLLDLYKVRDPGRREGLLRLGSDAWQVGWWDGYAEDAASSLIDLAWIEDRSLRIRCYDAVLVHGLLQTREYAQELMRIDNPQITPTALERMVELRMTRQQILNREQQPTSLMSIVDESVLRRLVGGPDVMKSQLHRLVELASAPNIDVRVLPLGSGAQAEAAGTFWLFTLPEGYPSATCVETIAGSIFLESEKIDRIETAYDRLLTATLDPEASLARLKAIAQEY